MATDQPEYEPEFVTTDRRDAVGYITLDRPDAHNALDEQMASELRDAVVGFVEDDGVRCVALTGTGGTFCTGADLSALEGDEGDAARLRAVATRLHTAVRHLVRAPKPTVTAVNGVAAGGGLGLSLAGDVVLASDAARFEFAYPRIALSGDGGSTWLLPRILGHRRARELALLDEPIDPDEAVESGMATEVVPAADLDDRLDDLAGTLADGPTRAYAETKQLLDESHRRSLGEQLEHETETIARLTGTEDWKEGHEKFFAKEDPEFEGQ